MARMPVGVRPSISLASWPTAITFSPRPLGSLATATTLGSEQTSPLPRTYTRVLAVPRSMARSWENEPATKSRNIEAVLLLGVDPGYAWRIGVGRQKLRGRGPPALRLRRGHSPRLRLRSPPA